MRVCITLVVACTGLISAITAAPFQSRPYRSSNTALSEARSVDMDIFTQLVLNLAKNTFFPAAKKHLETGEPLPRKVIWPAMLNMFSNFFSIMSSEVDQNHEIAPMMKDMKDIISTHFAMRDSKLPTKKELFTAIFQLMSKVLPIFNKKASTDNELLPFLGIFKDTFSLLRDRVQGDKEGEAQVDYATVPKKNKFGSSSSVKLLQSF